MKDRVLRVNNLIKKELGKIIFQELDLNQGTLVTITRVQTFPNLIQSNVYISLIGENAEKTFEILKKRVYNIQQALNKKLKMRPVPKIFFKKEQETEKAAKIEELLEKIKEK